MPSLNLPSRLTAFPNILPAMLLAFAALALPGCFHNDDDPAPPPPIVDANPTGYYSGLNGTTSVSDGADGTIPLDDLQAMVSGNRIMMLSVDDKLLYDGTITSISGNSYTADFAIYSDGENPVQATASGTIITGSSISGTLSGTGIGNDGTFNLLYANTNDQAAAVVDVTWRSERAGGGFDEFGFEIDDAGNLTHDENASFGSLFFQCKMNGTVTAINGTRLYHVDVELTLCGNSSTSVINGNYTGLATTKDGFGTNDRLVFLVSNSLYALSGEFEDDNRRMQKFDQQQPGR